MDGLVIGNLLYSAVAQGKAQGIHYLYHHINQHPQARLLMRNSLIKKGVAAIINNIWLIKSAAIQIVFFNA